MEKEFLLDTETARLLYHQVAEELPIIDFHCHLSPKEIAEDKHFRSITELWLGGDHYKWRAMRANGVPEKYITGDASDWEKFEKWAQTVPYTMRNPLYHWTHLELASAFGIHEPLNPASAKRIYDECNRQLATMGARDLMLRYNVETVCTTDDPIDSLEHHQAIRESGFKVNVYPAWRPDKVMNVSAGKDYLNYIAQLSKAAKAEIADYPSLLRALDVRMDFFADNGCRVADHGVSRFPDGEPSEAGGSPAVHELFRRVLDGEMLSPQEAEDLQTAIFADLCRLNNKKGWAQQFHFGPMRNVNSRAYRTLGPDTGFDTIGDYRSAEAVAKMLNALDETGDLAPTILYNLNPADNTWVAAMIGNFQDGSKPGKMQMGAAWWFNDQLYGMEAQLNALSMQGLLSRFVGMLTDSRSFLSYPRHDYFRRLLCRLLGRDIEAGLIPAAEIERVRGMVADICYYNPKTYFGF